MAEQTTEPKLHKDGVLTLDGMKATIQNGGMVLHGGKFITKVDDLPTAAELAKGDPKEEKRVAADLQQQMKDLQAQLDELKKPTVTPEEQEASEFAVALSGYQVVGKARAKALLDAGFSSRDKILAASNEELSKVKGFEKSEDIDALRNLLNG